MISLVELVMILGLATLTAAGASHGVTLLRQSRGGRIRDQASAGEDELASQPSAGAWHTPRHDRRYRMRCPVEILTAGGGMMNGTLLNLSKQGLRVASEQPVMKGTVLSLRIYLPGQSTPLAIDEAIVRWTSRTEYGVEVTSLNPEAAARFSDYLSAHSPDAHRASAYAVSPFSYY